MALSIMGVRCLSASFQLIKSSAQSGPVDPNVKTKTRDDPDGSWFGSILVSVDGTDETDGSPTLKASVGYGAWFKVSGEGGPEREEAQSVHAPAMLYSFAREHIYDLMRRGGFNGAVLPPLNFFERAREGDDGDGEAVGGMLE